MFSLRRLFSPRYRLASAYQLSAVCMSQDFTPSLHFTGETQSASPFQEEKQGLVPVSYHRTHSRFDKSN